MGRHAWWPLVGLVAFVTFAVFAAARPTGLDSLYESAVETPSFGSTRPTATVWMPTGLEGGAGKKRRLAQSDLGDGATTYAGCSCLDTWTATGGWELTGGTCHPGTPETEGLPWCAVNATTCRLPPASQQTHQYLLGGLTTLEWDFCLDRASADTTKANCSCLPVWGYGGQSFTGGLCQNPGNDPNGAWCLVAFGTCTGTPAGAPTAWHDGWDWCNGVSLDVAIEDPDDGTLDAEDTTAGDDVEPGITAGNATNATSSGSIEPSTTVSGCQCASTWRAGEEIVRGQCANPDRDPVGTWCRVDVRTCKTAPERSRQPFGAWDVCQPSALVRAPPTGVTRAGCKCKLKWSLWPAAGRQGNRWQYGCANPDNDPTGDWCPVDPSSCPPSADLPGTISGQHTPQPFDYCTPFANTSTPRPALQPMSERAAGALAASPRPHAMATVNATAPLAPGAPAAASAPGVGAVTDAGCACLSEWNYTDANGTVSAYTGGVCASPDADPAGEWCYVDAKTCLWQPSGQGARTRQYWDYCREQPASTPTPAVTQSGCQCKRSWQYPPWSLVPLGGASTALPTSPLLITNASLANPDDDPLGPWCVVKPQTCAAGLPYDILAPPEDLVFPTGVLPPPPAFYDYAPSALPEPADDDATRSSAAVTGADSVNDTAQALNALLGAILRPSDTLPLVNLTDLPAPSAPSRYNPPVDDSPAAARNNATVIPIVTSGTPPQSSPSSAPSPPGPRPVPTPIPSPTNQGNVQVTRQPSPAPPQAAPSTLPPAPDPTPSPTPGTASRVASTGQGSPLGGADSSVGSGGSVPATVDGFAANDADLPY